MSAARRICVVTGTRAEYGLMRGLIAGIRDDDAFELQLAVTGMHLSPEFGLTWREIEADGFPIDERVEILLSSDTPVGVSKAMGLGLIGFADAFARLKPDLVVVLGDRFEILAAASAALVAGIPIAHIHGGETTEGAFDEAIRHSVTKMSHLHFTAAAPYRDRVIQLGEAPERVFLVGGLGIDAIKGLKLLDRAELEGQLDLEFGARNLMVTFHPPTLEPGEAAAQMQALLDALDSLGPETHLLFTMPNADTGGRELAAMVDRFVAARPHARVFTSLGQLRYLSCMRLMDGVVGNSSSGLIETPSFGIGTVNIGDRQAGRLKAASVIDCAPQQDAIEAALERLFSDDFRKGLAGVENPYGTGGATMAILDVLRRHPLSGLLKKSFHDIALATDTGER
ncbi:UDP-N-acetylglucosamine 2-epimerase [Sphingomonas sp. MS122]|uniref:UDP-N-acetylglucosamine 2-epimerase n=1 Tax=Sphingomonas sp. MS122 TaxID=3412683 RepID=UPI003C2C66B0